MVVALELAMVDRVGAMALGEQEVVAAVEMAHRLSSREQHRPAPLKGAADSQKALVDSQADHLARLLVVEVEGAVDRTQPQRRHWTTRTRRTHSAYSSQWGI